MVETMDKMLMHRKCSKEFVLVNFCRKIKSLNLLRYTPHNI